MNDLKGAAWRKSSYSGGGGGECIEIADNVPGVIPVRDSKNPEGPRCSSVRRPGTPS